MKEKIEITAVIPVREGSRRLKNKNILPFAETSLLEYKISQLKQVKQISTIVVSSDSEEMLNIAKHSDVKIQKRPIEYCDEKTKSWNEVVEYITKQLDGEHILWAFCTSPFIEKDLYELAITEYFKALENGYDSLVSVNKIEKYIWSDEGTINYNFTQKPIIPKSQLPNYYWVTDGIYLAPRQKMIEWQFYHGIKPFKFIIDKRSSVDIDDELDYLQAHSWLDIKNNLSKILNR